MADTASERTEQPTPERLRKAREEGQILQSQEVNSALLLAALLVTLSLSAPALYDFFAVAMRDGLSFRLDGPLTGQGLMTALFAAGAGALLILTPVFVAMAAVSVLSGLLTGGLTLSTKALKFDFDRISPARGIKSLFSFRSLMHLAVSLAKLTVILLLVWAYLRDKLGECLALQNTSPEQTLVSSAQLIFSIIGRIVVAMMVIAAADLLYQRFRYYRELRMSRQEVKEERKQYELGPEVRGRIRRIQIEMARRRMLVEVPKADVVLVNPTHVAVALQYDARIMQAPRVLAKGGDLLCQKIKEIAAAHGVPVLHRPELARTLYAALDVGELVPEHLFVAVAEVLAVIYRLRGRHGAVRHEV